MRRFREVSYTHRIHIYLGGLRVDIRDAGMRYAENLRDNPQLLEPFTRCMRELYPSEQ